MDALPDGLCLDADGGIWAALPGPRQVVRLLDGDLTHVVMLDDGAAGMAIACVLGGTDRRTLLICCGLDIADAEESRAAGRGSVWAARVAVGGGTTRP